MQSLLQVGYLLVRYCHSKFTRLLLDAHSIDLSVDASMGCSVAPRGARLMSFCLTCTHAGTARSRPSVR